jgi:hypothetical protein
MRRSSGPIGLPAPAVAFVRLRGVPCSAVPDTVTCRVDPLVRLASSAENRSPAPISGGVATAPIAFHEVSLPHRDIHRPSPPFTRPPRARSVPSSTFRTSSTACSSIGLAGLFHPAATSGIRSPGVLPLATAVRARRSPSPSAVAGCCHPTDLRVVLGARIRGDATGVGRRVARSPRELRLPRVSSPRTAGSWLGCPSVHGLSRPSTSSRCVSTVGPEGPPTPSKVRDLPGGPLARRTRRDPHAPGGPLRPPIFVRLFGCQCCTVGAGTRRSLRAPLRLPRRRRETSRARVVPTGPLSQPRGIARPERRQRCPRVGHSCG